MKRQGFTLAEVLITLTIIGVIAAMTVPTLISKYQKHTYVVGLKKAYSEISNAVKMIPMTEGCPAGDYDCAGAFNSIDIEGKNFNGKTENKLTYLLSKNIKHQLYCDSKNASNKCQNIPTPAKNQKFAFFITDNGSIIVVNDSTAVTVDVNGQKGPNKIGRDIFAFVVAQKDTQTTHAGNVMAIGSMSEAKYRAEFNYNITTGNAWMNYYWKFKDTGSYGCVSNNITKGCTARVLEENAMNY